MCTLDSLDQSGIHSLAGQLARTFLNRSMDSGSCQASKTLGTGTGQSKHPHGSLHTALLLGSVALCRHQWLQERLFLFLGPEHNELFTGLQTFDILHLGKLHFGVQSIPARKLGTAFISTYQKGTAERFSSVKRSGAKPKCQPFTHSPTCA